ncbi:CAP domain-containing protein [Pacificoceanicola onchidii]|uniref:CAP domain-containing protein n=1 Tax=Pacificoceanicola onchidii TaxID=2562685 RepID=UPI0010A5DD70|nr:CAP domain-containing protein [Pacificoceanicola onchidii]
MNRRSFLALSTAVVLTACAEPQYSNALGPDGKPLPKVYRIGAGATAKIQFRTLDSVNALRQAAGAPPLQLDARLTAAAATHARDMSVQNRPWHFGSDGSSPIDRVQRAGYQGRIVGENISETFESELETLGAWMEDEATRKVILDPSARDLGFAWHQESGGKIWWTLITGSPELSVIPGAAPAIPS